MTNIFETMVKLQHKFNEETIENYLDKNLNWNSAIIAESGELLDSLGYKWWKKTIPDMENVKVEAIDLLHFTISRTLQEYYTPLNVRDHIKIQNYIENTCADFKKYFTEIEKYDVVDFNIEQLVRELIRDRFDGLLILKLIFQKLNMSNEDVYIAYIVKNCLNKFRQDNGYKKGFYIKDWNGKEDNVVAYDIAKKLDLDEGLFDQLYIDLSDFYHTNIKVKAV